MASPRTLPICQSRASGFTLIEAVMVMVITGILAAIVAVFITKPVQGYMDSVRRAELTDAADVVMRRLVRDVHLALPNSVRVVDSDGHFNSCVAGPTIICYIEFIMTSGGGRYRGSGDGSIAGNFLDFTTPTNKTFDVLGPMPSNPAIAVNDYIVVYNLGPGNAPADAYASGNICTTCNRAQVQSISGNTITLKSNPFGSQSPPLPSPNNSFQVVPGSVMAVTYACPTGKPGNLTRNWNYGFNPGQSTAPGGTSALLASNVTCVVAPYSTTNTVSKGLLTITLVLTDPTSQDQVTLVRQIHVDNTP